MYTVLLVEDEPNQQLLYQQELEDAGYQVRLATDGWQALRAIRSKQPDLVVLDLSMTGIDGLEVLERIHLIDSAVRPFVIVHSAFDLRLNNRFLRMADAYVVKNSNLESLLAQVRRLLPVPQTIETAAHVA